MNVRAGVCVGLLAALSLALGCPGKSGADGGTDGGPGNGDGGPKADGGTGGDGGGDGGHDAGPSACQSDSDCLGLGTRCAPDGGCTLPAVTCDPKQGSSNCSVAASYCWTDGINTTNNCYCDTLADGGGVCYVQVPPCGACVNQIDCGPASQVDNPGYCGQVGTEGTFCLPLDTGGCDSFPGFVAGSVDSTNVCVPSCGACPCSACVSDSDCPVPAVGVCNDANGACEPPCQAATDCANGEVCNVLGKYLDPTLGRLYAAGRCGVPCAQTSDCGIYQGDAGEPYFCDLDAGPLCRPSGCISDKECVQPGVQNGDVISWCDIWNGNDCVSDTCRLGYNPIGDTAYDDCIGGYACYLPDGGVPTLPDSGPPIAGACLPVPCYQVPGGAHTDCNAGQFCCGEGDAGTDNCGGADAGECYEAPRPPWCAACDPNNGTYFSPDCASVNDGYAGPVACLTAHGIATNPPSWCSPTCDPNEPWTCPSGWNCATQPAIFTDCSSCTECLDAGQIMGTQVYQCGCGGLLGCPSMAEALYEGTSCTTCPNGAGGCQQAADGTGFNCTCTPGGAACPAMTYGGQSYPSSCTSVSGTNVCAVSLQTQCAPTYEADGGLSGAGVCVLGYNCTSGHYGCPDAG